ncbi:MAG: hypothetical protein AAGG11_21505 [Pseudomonadota bacterium]
MTTSKLMNIARPKPIRFNTYVPQLTLLLVLTALRTQLDRSGLPLVSNASVQGPGCSTPLKPIPVYLLPLRRRPTLR